MGRGPTETDKLIGQNIKRFRNGLGLSQEMVAAELKVSFQQVQKYENGINRVSADVLFQLTRILKQPLNMFYSDGSEKPQQSEK